MILRNIGKIIIIEDDADEHEIIESVLAEILKESKLEGELVFLEDGAKALDYFKNSEKKPFLVISDINMPGLNGIDMRTMMVRNLKLKALCSPFIFFSTTIPASGFKIFEDLEVTASFSKPANFSQYKAILRECLAIGAAAGSTSLVCSDSFKY